MRDSVAQSEKAREATTLKRLITRSLRKQGFEVNNGRISLPAGNDKATTRSLHRIAVQHRITEEARFLQRYEERLLDRIANGSQISIAAIKPKLIEVRKGTEEALLFRYLQLHWSIPVSKGYGRRMRFLVVDESNQCVMGIIGLGDPVYALRARDQWIGWNKETKSRNLFHVLDAYVLGAIPPYSFLLGGKLMALLALSQEIQRAFRQKYGNRPSLMSGIVRRPYLALITTSSALGRSSVYNRLKINGNTFWHPLGFTSGSGDFHFANGLYARIRKFSETYCCPTAKSESWGSGFRNRREVIGKCLSEIGLPNSLAYHSVSREIFAAPCADNSLPFLRGEVKRLKPVQYCVRDLFEMYRERWLLPRSQRIPNFGEFEKDSYRLWGIADG